MTEIEQHKADLLWRLEFYAGDRWVGTSHPTREHAENCYQELCELGWLGDRPYRVINRSTQESFKLGTTG